MVEGMVDEAEAVQHLTITIITVAVEQVATAETVEREENTADKVIL
jgi:hypothetical protein